jgi:hypothetical protein
MDKVIGASIAVLLLVLALTFMALAWRARMRQGTRYHIWPALTGDVLESVDVLYVATTLGTNSLERIALRGFTYRGFAKLEIFANGVQVRLSTNDILSIPAEAFRRYEFSQVAIDKVVEKEGLIGLTWESAPGVDATQELTTFVRLRDSSSRNRLTNRFEKLVSPTTKEETA